MGLTREATLRLLRNSFILLCKLVLVDVVCAPVSGWLAYFYLKRNMMVAPPISNLSNKRLQRDSGIQVIICGFPRSGCTSLWQAMDILGFPCFHIPQLTKPSSAKLFMKAHASGTRQDWEELLQGYKSIVDFPAAMSYKQLVALYPNAKVILNLRDPMRWYNSFSQTIVDDKPSLAATVIRPYARRCFELFLSRTLTKEQYITKYKQHVEEVKRDVPSHKLYVLNIERNEGWAPLCEFLEVPIPDVPFPLLNKRDDMRKLRQILHTIYSILVACYLFLLFNVVIRSWRWFL